LLFYIFDFRVLVGAFCKFRHADTGKPVQIFACFRKSAPILGFVGLI